jgi:predicted N-acetyltransferase YhbS
MEIVPFTDEHLDAAAEMLAARHARHREVEPLLPELSDTRAAVEAAWRKEGAAGVFASDGYLFGTPEPGRWFTVGIAGHVVLGDPERARDLYAAAAGDWVDAGHTQQMVFVPASHTELVDAWFRLSFGASAVLAIRETGPEEPFDGGVAIRPGTPEDFGAVARLELAMYGAMQPSPSFSGLTLQSPEEIEAEWREEDFSPYELFVAERDGAIAGHVLLYRRPPDLRVPSDAIDLAQVSVYPEARGTGVGRALTAHAIAWAHEHGHPTMVTDWRLTNLWASRFWPKRGFRTTFVRLYRSIS